MTGNKLTAALDERENMEIREGLRKPKFEDVEREIRRLAHEHPDRKTYPHYMKNGEPCCIFGHALYNLGVPVENLREYDRANLGADEETEISAGDTLDPAATRVEKAWANEVQLNQDLGAVWRKAVEGADRRFRNG